MGVAWQAQTRAWLAKRGANEFADECVLFFEQAFRAPLRVYPQDAWFGVHDSYASLTIGNMWLAAIGTRPRCAYLIVEHDLQMKGIGYLPIPSTFKYVPLGFLTVKAWDKMHALNQNKRVWDSYARACELILQSPISRNVITRNLHRKVRLSELQSVKMMDLENIAQEFVSRDPEIMSGALVFRGTRVLVQTLFDYVDAGDSLAEFLDDFPTVAQEQALGVLALVNRKLKIKIPK